MGFFNKLFSRDSKQEKQEKETLDKGLEKTKTGFFSKIKRVVARGRISPGWTAFAARPGQCRT